MACHVFLVAAVYRHATIEIVSSTFSDENEGGSHAIAQVSAEHAAREAQLPKSQSHVIVQVRVVDRRWSVLATQPTYS